MSTTSKPDWSELDTKIAVTGQISVEDIPEIAAAGYKSIICNRPDGEGGASQPASKELENAAKAAGLKFAYMPVEKGPVSDDQCSEFHVLMQQLPGPVLAFCGSGKRAKALYTHNDTMPVGSGDELSPTSAACNWGDVFDIVIVGGGSAGIGVAASLLRRRAALRIAIIEPSDKHYYQPAWTLVGGGAYDLAQTARNTADIIPDGAEWIQAEASGFSPDENLVHLTDGRAISYRQLIVCPGLRLAWEKIEGAQETLGKNGVTSNYQFEFAQYTWELTQQLKGGKALFTQPPMPVKCPGAPQKAMYLSCDHWQRQGVLDNIDVEFNNAGAVLFGISEFVPPLMKYVKKYNAKLEFGSNLVKIDGEKKIATFDVKDASGNITQVEKNFDMLHVTPPQAAPDFLRNSPLANEAGFCEVDQRTLQHVRYPNIFSLGDACSSPNSKTAAAVRKQVVIVAKNLLAAKEDRELKAIYDGYGACPLTVEKGKVVLAEFAFGGKLSPTFPLNPAVARRLFWWMKVKLFPWVYWDLLLKGHEWLAGSKAKK